MAEPRLCLKPTNRWENSPFHGRESLHGRGRVSLPGAQTRQPAGDRLTVGLVLGAELATQRRLLVPPSTPGAKAKNKELPAAASALRLEASVGITTLPRGRSPGHDNPFPQTWSCAYNPATAARRQQPSSSRRDRNVRAPVTDAPASAALDARARSEVTTSTSTRSWSAPGLRGSRGALSPPS